jgi:hypothetical protein
VYGLYDHDEEPQPLDRQLLNVLLESFEQARPWTLRELEVRFGNRDTVLASIRRLSRYGLATRMGFYVVASGAAIFHHQLQSPAAPSP